VAVAAGVVLAALGCGRQEDSSMSAARNIPEGPYYNFNPADRDFVHEAAEANLAELDASRLALRKAILAEVKTFAQHMIDDHTKVGADLNDLANKKGITLPAETDADHKMEAARLADLSGVEFDRAYIAAMVSDHAKAVSLFEEEPMKGRDADVRAFAVKTLPTLGHHLQMARDLRVKLGGAAAPN
jgi:putative membrane protein